MFGVVEFGPDRASRARVPDEKIPVERRNSAVPEVPVQASRWSPFRRGESAGSIRGPAARPRELVRTSVDIAEEDLARAAEADGKSVCAASTDQHRRRALGKAGAIPAVEPGSREVAPAVSGQNDLTAMEVPCENEVMSGDPRRIEHRRIVGAENPIAAPVLQAALRSCVELNALDRQRSLRKPMPTRRLNARTNALDAGEHVVIPGDGNERRPQRELVEGVFESSQASRGVDEISAENQHIGTLANHDAQKISASRTCCVCAQVEVACIKETNPTPRSPRADAQASNAEFGTSADVQQRRGTSIPLLEIVIPDRDRGAAPEPWSDQPLPVQPAEEHRPGDRHDRRHDPCRPACASDQGRHGSSPAWPEVRQQGYEEDRPSLGDVKAHDRGRCREPGAERPGQKSRDRADRKADAVLQPPGHGESGVRSSRPSTLMASEGGGHPASARAEAATPGPLGNEVTIGFEESFRPCQEPPPLRFLRHGRRSSASRPPRRCRCRRRAHGEASSRRACTSCDGRRTRRSRSSRW